MALHGYGLLAVASAACWTRAIATVCDCDAGSMFCNDRHDFYDCSLEGGARACFANISKGAQKCACLKNACASSAGLYSNEPAACLSTCTKPAAAEICPDYDDQHYLCNYYSRWMCAMRTAECKRKPAASDSEAECNDQAHGDEPSDTLDSFLICLGGGIQAGATEDRSATALV
eukprot:TRINITY_DN10503_c0_g1_i1.p2 TRINITY_DN10503_c0_g1~~TRINITY_DN10503_c0_g1_i1.p2  ORF type:complete len:174 (+),score=25.78 TRINITY_DN10503_c0_g1_i1:87-608(+)